MNMVEIKHSGKSMEQRIRDRYKNSGGEEADFTAKVGEGPNRLFHNSHHTGNVHQRGQDVKGVGIDGRERGPANRDGEIK
jgi:hypothetical protein